MKTLLSPLFYVQRFCKHCARSYYKENPGHWIWQHELARLPPLGMFEPAEGFTPDLPVLLMFDEFIVDEEAIALIQESKEERWLGQWPDVIAYLQAEGSLKAVDLHAVVKEAGALRSGMTRRDMRHPARWSEAMDFHDSLINAAGRAFTEIPDKSAAVDWSFDPKMGASVPGKDKEAHSMAVVLREEIADEVHSELLPIAIEHLKRQLAEVNAGIAASITLGAAPMFWAPYREYLSVKAALTPTIQAGTDASSAARIFFEVAFPRFGPESVRDLSKLRKDHRLTSLRNEIERAYRSGDAIDRDYPQAVLQEALDIDRRVGKIRKITTWLSAAIGTIPIPGISLAATAAGELVASRVESRVRKPLDWLYVISDGVGIS